MKNLLYAFLLLLSVDVHAEGNKNICLKVNEGAKVFKHKTREKITLNEGAVYKPLKYNKSKTYILFDNNGYKWIAKEDLTFVQCDELNLNKAVAVKSKVESVFRKLQFKIGYSFSGSNSAGYRLITNITDANDVRLEQRPIFKDTPFTSSFEISGGYRWDLGPKVYLRSQLGFRMNTHEIKGLHNPDSFNAGVPVTEDQLEVRSYGDFKYNSAQISFEYGRELFSNNKIKILGYLGAEMQYRLTKSVEKEVLICGTTSCPFKSTTGVVNAPIDQTVISPTISIELEYKKFLLGLDFDVNYIPTLNMGMLF